MRLANGIVIDKEKTFGVLKFSALRREVHVQNEDGTVSEEIKERTYDLKCNTQGRMIQVSVPATIPLKNYDYNAEVELINPVGNMSMVAVTRTPLLTVLDLPSGATEKPESACHELHRHSMTQPSIFHCHRHRLAIWSFSIPPTIPVIMLPM